MNCWAISTAKRKPAHAAETSRQAALVAPIFVWTRHAVAGNSMSGVAVARRIRSISLAEIPACSIAAKAALGRHVAREFVLRRDPALFDAGARGDPFVGRVDHLREIGVGQDFFRRVAAGADDRNGAPRFTGARARAGLSFHDNGGFPRRYAGSPGVQSIRRPRAKRS